MSELEKFDKAPRRSFRGAIPDRHRGSLDTRLAWLWNQRFGTVQTIYRDSKDVLDHTAATMILQAIMGKDLDAIDMLLHRIEGGAVMDEIILEEGAMRV